MVPCELEEEKAPGFPGTTLYSKRDARLKPTGVYLPADSGFSGRVDVALWLHG
jgi:hypothetical protein